MEPLQAAKGFPTFNGDGRAQLSWVIQRVTWLEEQFAMSKMDQSELEEHPVGLETIAEEPEEPEDEKAPERTNALGPAQTFNTSSSSTGADAAVELLGVRLAALELHHNARLETVEDMVKNRCDLLQDMVCQGFDTLRVEWQEALDTGRANFAQTMVQAFSEELQLSIVSQAVSEVRSEIFSIVHSEVSRFEERLTDACADIVRQEGQLASLNEHFHTLAELQPATDSGAVTLEEKDPDLPPAQALQQFGDSIVQLESTIGGLLRSIHDSRAESLRDGAMLRRDLEEVNKKLQQLICSDIADVQERLRVVEAQADQNDHGRHEVQFTDKEHPQVGDEFLCNFEKQIQNLDNKIEMRTLQLSKLVEQLKSHNLVEASVNEIQHRPEVESENQGSKLDSTVTMPGLSVHATCTAPKNARNGHDFNGSRSPPSDYRRPCRSISPASLVGGGGSPHCSQSRTPALPAQVPIPQATSLPLGVNGPPETISAPVGPAVGPAGQVCSRVQRSLSVPSLIGPERSPAVPSVRVAPPTIAPTHNIAPAIQTRGSRVPAPTMSPWAAPRVVPQYGQMQAARQPHGFGMP